MFEKDLSSRLQRIFDFKKTRFDDPGESFEQECLFVNVERAICDIKEARQRARVTGLAYVYASADKLPFGYFNKQIAHAMSDDVVRFFFFEIDSNLPVMNNIVRRSVKFVFFYDAQYDPSLGTITSVALQEGE